jgi:hypothetical protein
MPSARRFSAALDDRENNGACFIVRDNTGQAFGNFYFEDEPGRRSAAKLLTRDEAEALVGLHNRGEPSPLPSGFSSN